MVDARHTASNTIFDPCEYDRETDGPSWGYPVGRGVYVMISGCQNQAELIVGVDGKWRLCRDCAALPRFNRYRVRREIKRG